MANEVEEKSIGGVKTVEVAAPKTATGKDAEGKPEGHRKLSVMFDFGASIDEAVEKFGEDVVFAGFVASATIDLQNYIRTKLEAVAKDADGKVIPDGGFAQTDVEIEFDFASWKPGIKTRERVSPMDKIKKLLGGLSAAQKEALLAGLGE
jgi:hypothetical protein